MGRSNEKAHLYIVNYKADWSRGNWVPLCSQTAVSFESHIRAASSLCVCGLFAKWKGNTSSKKRAQGISLGIAAKLVLQGSDPLLEGVLNMLCFEWVGKNVSFYLSVVHLILRPGHSKLMTNCVHHVHLIVLLDLLVNGFMEAISNMWYELLVIYYPCGTEIFKQNLVFSFSSVRYLSISTIGRKTYGYFVLYLVWKDSLF